jgi:hypothetical protein
MYVGAAASLLGIVIDILTVKAATVIFKKSNP